jgi:hypothetical protein
MIKLFKEIAEVLEETFHQLESGVPPPSFVSYGKGKAFKYKDKSIEAAIIQKSARLVSGLNASLILLEAGYVQELGALFRMLDEFNDDIMFLCQGLRTGEITKLHKDYIDIFYQDEFDDPSSPLLSQQKRAMIPRKKIHAAITRMPEHELNESDSNQIYRTLSQAYSGYIHAASTHVMEMYVGIPGRFYVSGMLGSQRIDEFTNNAWDYFYRGLHSIMIVALTFKEHDIANRLFKFRGYVEKQSNRTDWEQPEELVKRMKPKKE